MSSDENSSAPPPTPKLARAPLQVQTQHSAVMGIDNLLSPSPPARSPSAFVRPQYPASSSPNSPHYGGLRRRSTIPDLRSGIRHPRHSTPVLDNETEEDGETGTFEEMMGDDDDGWTQALHPYASSVSSPSTRVYPTSDPLPSVEPMSTSVFRTQQDQAHSPPYSPSPTPSLVHSDEVFEENEVIVYDKVPPSESVAVLNRGGQHSPRVQPWVYGSMRGRYLEYNKGDLKKQQQSIREREKEKPGLSRKPENLLEEHDTSKHWDIKFADSKKQRARSCTWLNKMWGPPIGMSMHTDWRPRNGPHPSSTGRLNMQYQGRFSGPIYAPTRHNSHDSGIGDALPSWKRSSIDNVPGESPFKKPRLRLTVGPPPPPSPREAALDYPDSPPDSPQTPPGPTECNNCLVHEDHTELFECAKCGEAAWCSTACRNADAASHELSCRPVTPSQADLSQLSIMDDPRNYATDDDIEVTTAEIADDDMPLQEIGEPREIDHEPREILEWRIQGLRWIEYLVAYDGADTWRSATSLRGDGWDLNMNHFWQSSPRNKLWVKFALIPPLYGIAPGILKLTVTRTFIESYRTLRFDVQEYDNIRGNDWRKASELGAE
ncbi:hypothetical protein LTR56_025085 [Elasticomyces elasticus]|nr:hypothetical protein LTR56_025085 [Elasticomyces elasticus]KAK3621267.1 hypothetical protein LTR22_025262 [Elasticomyces elasticus]KAK4904952.1 hypothetical protein LTR49_025683 [Elasticomyces elasticus]KAK5741393.1 hypothetical protein LTS12_024629 [Elasticomyces elasticus]